MQFCVSIPHHLLLLRGFLVPSEKAVHNKTHLFKMEKEASRLFVFQFTT